MQLFLRNFWPMLAMFFALIVTFGFYANAEKQVDRAIDLRYLSFVLANQLRQSSDDLTRMARTYVVTGDSRYKEYYQDILDIRDGKKPRPNEYPYAYWDGVLADAHSRQTRTDGGSAIALLEQMRQVGLTEDELHNLTEAKANSDALAAIEFEAMKLADSVGPDAETNRAKALLMLHDASFHRSKAAIMRSINEAYARMDKRTTDAVHAAKRYATTFRAMFVLFALGVMFMLWRIQSSLRASKRQYQQANDRLHLAAAAFETQEAIMIADPDFRIVRVNRAFCALTGYTADEIIGRDTNLLSSGRHGAAFYEKMHNCLKNADYWTGQIWDKRKNGELYLARLAISVVRDATGEISHYVSTSVDLTEHIKDEKRLADMERFTHGVLDALTSHIAVLNSTGIIVFTNRAWREFVQRNEQPPERVSEGMDYLGVCQQAEIMGDEAAAVAAALIRDLISGHRMAGSFEYPCHSSQEERWFICRGTRFSGDGSVHVVMLHTDITERVQGEEELRRLNENLDATLQTIPDLLLELDEQGRYHEIWVQDTALLAVQKERLLGATVSEMLPPEAAQTVLDAIREAAETGVSRGQQIRLPLSHGEFWFELSTARKQGKPGEPLRFIVLSRNITERKQAEEAVLRLNQELEIKVLERTVALQQANIVLATAEEETRAVVYYMVDCTITFDENGLVRSANVVTEKIFGYSVDELLGQEVFMLLSESSRALYAKELDNYRHTGMSNIIGVSIEGEGVHKNGERIALEVTLSEYVIQGKHYFTAILRDIRERVRIMKALEQARFDAEQASLAKSAFLAAMSHEIRTPMNGVVGMADILQQTSLRGYQVEIVDTIRDSAYSLLGIIEDILDFSKIEAGRLEVEYEVLSVTAVVEQVCKMLDYLATKKEVEFTLFTDPAIPEMVLGDALRLRQILVNLVNNAIKFSSKEERSGKVSLRIHLAERSPETVTVVFTVTDNGIGMNEATQARLFTSFSQADASTTRRFGGTGLGLAIASNLTVLMGGGITVHSMPDEGSTFTVRLPFRSLPIKSDAGKVVSEVAGLNCLVVGSPGGLADDLATYLTQDGAGVARAPNLARAREWADSVGLSVWVIDAGAELMSADKLHLATAARPDQDIRFVLIGRGYRRKPRTAAGGLVIVDGNVLGRQTFLNAVAIAAGRMQRETEASTPFIQDRNGVSPPSREEALRQGRLILVAEDNEINQKVILRQLGLLGFAADITRNGREALSRWESGNYALLLTDLHMPEMDGYELSRSIRSLEVGERRIPIITLTANALQGEAERCRMAGIDDYLSKPVSLAALEATLNKWLPSVVATMTDMMIPLAIPMASGVLPAAAPLAIDVNVLKALVGDDAAVVREFLQDFRASTARVSAELRAACQEGQAKAAGAIAHKLKSSARAVGALALGELCAAMEQAGKDDANETLATLLPRFEQALLVMDASLDSLLS